LFLQQFAVPFMGGDVEMNEFLVVDQFEGHIIIIPKEGANTVFEVQFLDFINRTIQAVHDGYAFLEVFFYLFFFVLFGFGTGGEDFDEDHFTAFQDRMDPASSIQKQLQKHIRSDEQDDPIEESSPEVCFEIAEKLKHETIETIETIVRRE